SVECERAYLAVFEAQHNRFGCGCGHDQTLFVLIDGGDKYFGEEAFPPVVRELPVFVAAQAYPATDPQAAILAFKYRVAVGTRQPLFLSEPSHHTILDSG